MMRLTGKGSILNKLLHVRKDPISARARNLNDRARELKAEIRRLEKQSSLEPKFRKTTSVVPRPAEDLQDRTSMGSLFETVEHESLRFIDVERDPEAHYNALGVRKLDPIGWVRRHTGKKVESSNPPAAGEDGSHKWVQYLATGGIQGIEPLRREKRIERNRFLMMFVLFLLILCGIFAIMRPV